MNYLVKEDYISKLKTFAKASFDDFSNRISFLDDFGWPSPINENWRLSRLGKLSRKDFLPNVKKLNLDNKVNKTLKNSFKIVFDNGIFNEKLSDNFPDEIEITLIQSESIPKYFKNYNDEKILSHPTFKLCCALSKNFIQLKIKKNASLDFPIEIIHIGGLKSFSTHSLMIIDIEENCNVKILENFNSRSGLITYLELVRISHNSKLDIVKIFNDSDVTYNLSLNLIDLYKKSTLNSFNYVKGGEFVRNETHTFLNKENSKVQLNGVYLSSDTQHHDLTSAIYHNSPNCHSLQKIRGVLNKKSTGVFQGKVYVNEIAQKTDAQQMSKALLLSNEANSNSKPELEIFADDVVCSHGATVGELDEEQLFYLLSRGIPKEKAKLILVEAFVNEIISSSVNEDFLDEILVLTKNGFNDILKAK